MKKREDFQNKETKACSSLGYSGITFFKFATAIIESGLWAKMSATARTLYPVLLRFSDRNFKYVYPGAQHLLKLTGFKSKASLKKARKELVKLGLISVQTGYGRKNTRYFFHFETVLSPEGYFPPPQQVENMPLRDDLKQPSDREKNSPPDRYRNPAEGEKNSPLYNKINISINHQVPHLDWKEKLNEMRNQFGSKKMDVAISECRLAGMKVNPENLQKILTKEKRNWDEHSETQFSEWNSLELYLQNRISQTSMELISKAHLDENNGVLVFRSTLPMHLKSLLERLCGKIIFEPMGVLKTPTEVKEVLN